MKNTGYAHVNSNGEVDMNTASATPRATVVNALCICYGFLVPQDMPDSEIFELYFSAAKVTGCTIKQIRAEVLTAQEMN